MRPAHSKRTISIALMLLNTLLWGAALPIVKPALEVTTPFRYLFYRYLFAGIFSLPILFYFWPKVKNKVSNIPIVIVLEILGTTVALGLLYSGLALTTSIEASLIATTTPIFTTIGGILYLREKEERHEWIGLILAVVGTVLLAVEPLISGMNGNASFSLTGNMLVFGQNIAIAIYYILAKKMYKKLPKLFVTSISFYVGIVSFLVLSTLEFSAWNLEFPPTLALDFISVVRNDLSHPNVLLASLYMATFGSIIGLTAYIKGQDGMEASEASLFTYLQPIVYIPLATFFLKESVTLPMIIAVILIGIGVWWAEKRR